MAKFLVHVEDSVDYEIEAESKSKAKEIAWEWFTEREPTFKTEEIENQGTMRWSKVAKLLEDEIEINWDDCSFICPICEEPILEDDFYYIPAEDDKKGIYHPFCPICGCFFED